MRFQTKIFIVFAFLFGAALLLRSYMTYRVQKVQINEMKSDMLNVINVVHFATQRLASEKERDREALTQFITDAVRQHRALDEISVINSNQEIIASSNPQKIGKQFSQVWREKMADGKYHREDTLDWYEVTLPIVKNQKVIGHVQASILLSNAADTLSELYISNIIITIVLFVCISLVSFFVIRRMSAPLRSLAAAARRVAGGDLDVSISQEGRDERTEVAVAFNQMTERLREQRTYEERLRSIERNAILSETAATLAHEIRNPLNMINLTAGRLAHKFQPLDEKQQPEYMALISDLKSQVQYLNDMVSDFLAVGKPLKLRKTTFLLRDLVTQTELLVKQRIVAKDISFSVDVPEEITCIADIEQMRMALINLVNNAIEAAGSGGAVIVSGARENGAVVLKVSDNGPGIAAEEAERIFEPYYTKRSGGTGLGLTLVRRIVEEHGGKVSAENLPSGGARFIVTIPQKGE